MVKINGTEMDRAGAAVADVVVELGLDTGRIAAELNGSIVPAAEYTSVKLKDGDVLEIVSFVGGG